MDTYNPYNKNSNDITPYEGEKPYYEVDTAPSIVNQITPSNNNSQDMHDNKNNKDDYKKRIICASILLLICIIDTILQIFFDYINYFSLIDNAIILILVISFFGNLIINKSVKLRSLFLVILFIIAWIGGFVAKLYGYKSIFESENDIIIKIILAVVNTIFIAFRTFCLIMTFKY